MLLGGGALSAAAAPASADAASARVGTSFNDRLFPGQYISNGRYRLEMQRDGNLVLYDDSWGRACWASNTNGIDGVYADYDDSLWTKPSLYLKSGYGELRHWWGMYNYLHKTGNVSVNTKGEVWIAYQKFVSC
jgi:hypothetical protein